MASMKRLQKEFENIVKDPPSNCSAGLLDDNFYEWEARIIGPSETPYEGGVFTLHIHVPIDYPFKPPHCQFKTKIYHPNINHSGQICLDILKNQWTPAWTLLYVFKAILVLLSNPEPNSPLNCDAGNLLRVRDHRGFSTLAYMYSNIKY